jgi:hypothetical protein
MYFVHGDMADHRCEHGNKYSGSLKCGICSLIGRKSASQGLWSMESKVVS